MQQNAAKNLQDMWAKSSSVNTVNLAKEIYHISRDINFSKGITFLARPVDKAPNIPMNFKLAF